LLLGCNFTELVACRRVVGHHLLTEIPYGRVRRFCNRDLTLAYFC
jgi:hypothetical protein